MAALKKSLTAERPARGPAEVRDHPARKAAPAAAAGKKPPAGKAKPAASVRRRSTQSEPAAPKQQPPARGRKSA